MKYLERILYQMYLLHCSCLPMSTRQCRSFLVAANKRSLTTSDCGAPSLGLGVRFFVVSMSLRRVPQRGLRERVSIYCSTYRPYGYSCYGDNFVQRLDTVWMWSRRWGKSGVDYPDNRNTTIGCAGVETNDNAVLQGNARGLSYARLTIDEWLMTTKTKTRGKFPNHDQDQRYPQEHDTSTNSLFQVKTSQIIPAHE